MKPVHIYFNNIPTYIFFRIQSFSIKWPFQILFTFLSLKYSSLSISHLCLSPKYYAERRSVRDALCCAVLSSFLLLLHSWVSAFFLSSCFRIAPVNVRHRTSWNRVLPQKLTGTQLVKEFPIFYVTPNVRYHIDTSPPSVPILNQINPVHIVHPTYSRSILILYPPNYA